MNFSAIELTAVIENRLKNYYSGIKIDETGFFLGILGGVVRFFFTLTEV